MNTRKKSLWNEFSKKQPETNGYYLVSNGIKPSSYVVVYFMGNFYRKGYYKEWKTQEQNKDILKEYKTSKFKYWMNVPEFPEITKDESLKKYLWMCTANNIKTLNNSGIHSLNDLLEKSKHDLYALKGIKDSAFLRIIESLYEYNLPESWGTSKELIDLVVSQRSMIFIIKCLNISPYDVIKFYSSWPSHEFDKYDHCLLIETKSQIEQDLLISHPNFKALYHNKRGTEYYFNLDEKMKEIIDEQKKEWRIK